MSELFLPEMAFDKLQPGLFRYSLGPVSLVGRRLQRETAWAVIAKGMGQIAMRNLLVKYPGYFVYEDMIDKFWPDPDKMPDYFSQVSKHVFHELSRHVIHVGLRLRCKVKLGYRLEFIPNWKPPHVPVPDHSHRLRQPEKNNYNHRLTERVCPPYDPAKSKQ